MSRPRIVVLGARGFIGAAIVRQARALGRDVREIGSDDIDLTVADAGDQLRAALEVGDALVFVSAIAPTRSVDHLVQNIKMASAVCDAISAVDLAHVVYISSDAVYGDDDAFVTESTAPSPSSLHGVMHLAREVALRTTATMPLCIVRPSLVYGPDDPHNGYGPNRFLRQARAGEQITLFGEGEERRDHVHVDDVAALVHQVLDARTAGTLNAATGASRSFREVAELACALVPEPPPITGTPRQNPITHRSFDPTAVIRTFPRFSWTRLEDGLGRDRG